MYATLSGGKQVHDCPADKDTVPLIIETSCKPSIIKLFFSVCD